MSVTHLILEQSDQVIENISNETSLDTTDKLAQVSRGVNNTSDVQGKINVRAIYEDTLTYLTEQKWPNKLFITYGRQYIRFADSNVRSTLLTNSIGDGTQAWNGVTPSVANNAVIGQIFVSNTSITTFDEFNRFVSANANGNYSFYGCTNLRSINLSNCAVLPRVNSKGTFENCSSLTSISNLGTVQTITEGCFKGCSGLTSINIPSTCKQIDSQCFSACSNLNITQSNLLSVEDLGYTVSQHDNGIFGSKIDGTKGKYSSSTVNLPNLIKLGHTIFKNQTSIQSVYLPNVEYLSSCQVFNGCSNLETVIIGVRDNGDSTYTHSQITVNEGADYSYGLGSLFGGCSKLKSVQISNNLAVITGAMFINCTQLHKIDIDFTKITEIHGQAFFNCNNIGSQLGESKIMNFSNCTSIYYKYYADAPKRTPAPFYNSAGLHIYLPKLIQILPGSHNDSGTQSGFIQYSFIHSGATQLSTCKFKMDVLYLRDIQDIGRASFYSTVEHYDYADMYIKVLIIDNTTIPTMTNSYSDSNTMQTANTRSPFHNFNIGRIYVPDSALSSYQNSSLFAGRSFVTNHDNSTDISTILNSSDTAILPLSQYVTDSVLTAEDKAIIASHSHNLS